jgi:hypothetical protein
MDSEPIFIGGLSFSGKTLLRLILSCHPNIVITRRTYMWTRFYGRFGDLSQRDNFERCLDAMLQFKHMAVLQPDADRIRREFWQGSPSYGRLFGLFQAHFAARMGKPRWGDQLGFVEQYADPIFAAYPMAKMIHMIRDPRQRFKASTATVPGRKGKAGWEVAQWRRSAYLAIRNQQRYPDRYKVVRYEELLTAPEKTVPDICSFLKEKFIPAMLTLEGAFRMREGEGANPLNLEDKQMSAHQLNGAQIAQSDLTFIQMYARREMMTFAYQPENIPLSAQEWLDLCLRWPLNLVSMTMWPVWNRKKG